MKTKTQPALSPIPPALAAAVASRSSNRWRWNRAHLTITGKDADLEPYGSQSAEILGIRGRTVHCIAHIGKTLVGTDVCLNLEEGQDEEAAVDLWMDGATEIACGCGVAGEWDGDSWWMTEEFPFTVRLRATPELTAAAIAAKLEETLKYAEKELRLASKMMGVLAGWAGGAPEGSPCAGSVSAMLKEDSK